MLKSSTRVGVGDYITAMTLGLGVCCQAEQESEQGFYSFLHKI
jgi:hypothetical protein